MQPKCRPRVLFWRLLPGIRWARTCWRRAPPGETGVPGSPRYSTQRCPWGPRWPGCRPAGPRGCGRRDCTGSSWTGCSGCRSRWAGAAAAEPAGPRNVERSWPSWRTLEEKDRSDDWMYFCSSINSNTVQTSLIDSYRLIEITCKNKELVGSLAPIK